MLFQRTVISQDIYQEVIHGGGNVTLSGIAARKLVSKGQLDMQGNYLFPLLDLQAVLGTLPNTSNKWLVKRVQRKHL